MTTSGQPVRSSSRRASATSGSPNAASSRSDALSSDRIARPRLTVSEAPHEASSTVLRGAPDISVYEVATRRSPCADRCPAVRSSIRNRSRLEASHGAEIVAPARRRGAMPTTCGEGDLLAVSPRAEPDRAPHQPADVTGLAARQLIVIENERSANAPRSSVTRTVKAYVPAAVGVPVIRPGLSESSSPGGSSPATSVQV
jgi:hypothetical protein